MMNFFLVNMHMLHEKRPMHSFVHFTNIFILQTLKLRLPKKEIGFAPVFYTWLRYCFYSYFYTGDIFVSFHPVSSLVKKDRLQSEGIKADLKPRILIAESWLTKFVKTKLMDSNYENWNTAI